MTGCARCKDWQELGLSNTCPACDLYELERKDKMKQEKKDMICNDCGYEWRGDEGHCPDCDSENTQIIITE